MELKNIINVPEKETPDMTEKVIVEDGGRVKRIPINAIGGGGGSGAGFDLIIKATAAPEEESGESGNYIDFHADPESIELETELTFDELKEKWYYYSCLVGIDCSESGYVGEANSTLGFTRSNLCPEGGMNRYYWDSLDAETAGMLTAMGVDVSEGDSAFLLMTFLDGEPIYPVESGGDDGDYVEMTLAVFLTRGTDGEIVVTYTDAVG